MRLPFVALLLVVMVPRGAAAQPADCSTVPPAGPTLPLELDLAHRPGVPKGVTGQVYVGVPLGLPGTACADAPPPPRDVLHGEPGNVLGGPPSPDLLRGPGTPRVRVEPR